jgi:hypothetical protein
MAWLKLARKVAVEVMVDGRGGAQVVGPNKMVT